MELPTISSATTRLAEVFEYAVEGDLSPIELRDIAGQIRYNLLTVPGVADVVNRRLFRQYRVNLIPVR